MLHPAALGQAEPDEDDDIVPEPVTGDEVGRYTVLGHVGKGGMGVVYKAYDPQLDRNVAVKLLHRVIEQDDAGSERRLQREAQMLAQLQHPNVVAVYDAGLTRYGMFIAMELLYGSTLEGWLAERPRSVSEVLAVFRSAGEGLAAAHDAGFVHRDFKPSNVMVGDDGTVRVLDFGVASLMDGRIGLREMTGSSRRRVARPPGAVGPLSHSDPHLTDAGYVLGTPPYMAPEQVAGDKADHRSDQFTFCVCLHLALFGHSPVIGERLEERRWNLRRGRVLDERGLLTGRMAGRTAGRVPARVRRLLRRGLSVHPEDRFPSMRALLDELRDPPRRWPFVVGGMMLMLGFGVGQLIDVGEDPCAEVPSLEPDWNDHERAAVRAAFARSGHPQARELSGRVEQRIDEYAAAWSAMVEESCRDTYVTREQSPPLHDQRMQCLERRRNRMRSAVATLTHIEGRQQVNDRMLVPFQLPRLDDCAELELESTGRSALPDDPELRATVAKVRRSIDEVETLNRARAFEPGLALARAVVDDARQTGWSPVLAEALQSLGSMQAAQGLAREAQVTLEAAILEAAKAEDDVTAARAWTWLIYALMMQRQTKRGETLELAARAAVDRADDDEIRGWLLNNLGTLHSSDGHFERAVTLFEEALEVKTRNLGEEHVDVGITWHDYGATLLDHQRYSEAEVALRRAQSIFEATVGEDHPLTDYVIGDLCEIHDAREEYEAAIDLCSRVLARYEVSPASPSIMSRNTFAMARALAGVGRSEEARALGFRARQLIADRDPELTRSIETWLAKVEKALSPPQDSGGR